MYKKIAYMFMAGMLIMQVLRVQAADCIKNSSCASKTVFVPRPLTTDATLELALDNYRIYHRQEGENFLYMQASYFHEQSAKSDAAAGYFLPRGKCCVSVREDGTSDVDSLWLNVISAPGTSFSSEYCLRPQRRVDGGFFNFHFDLSRWMCGAWFSVAFAAAHTEHRLCPRERGVANPGTIPGFANVTEALNQPSWANRFSTRTLTHSGVDDIRFKLGYNCYWSNDCNHAGLYLMGVAPTGHGTRNRFIYEPLVGTRHGQIGVGINTDVTAWQCNNHMIEWMLDMNYRFGFKARECRSFDLCGRGDWSRFLQVVTPSAPSFSMPGINYFSPRINVEPRGTIEFWTAFNYSYCDCNFEVGYNLWWRQAEKICLNCPPFGANTIGVYDMVGDCAGNPTTANCTNITQGIVPPNVGASDTIFTPLSGRDLNLRSGAAPQVITNKIYAAASCTPEIWCTAVMLGVGGGYEFSHCKAFEQWTVFAKTSISF